MPVHITKSFTRISGSTLIDYNFRSIGVNASAASITVTLPSAVSAIGHEMRIKKLDASPNAVTIVGSLGQTIDDGSAAYIVSQNLSLDFVNDGSNWFIF